MSYNELKNIIEKMQIIQENALEYKKTKRISNYSKEISILSIVAALSLLATIGDFANIILIKILEASTILSTGLIIKKYVKLKTKRNKIEKEYPKVDFKNYDIKENQKTILRLLAQKTQYVRAEQEKARRQKFEEQLNQMENTKPIELACQAPPVHNQEPDTKGHVKSIGTLKRRG